MKIWPIRYAHRKRAARENHSLQAVDQRFRREQGDRGIYCGRTAPGEAKKTSQEVGARAVFESKIKSEEPWKIYKRAYKKYYARVMKGT